MMQENTMCFDEVQDVTVCLRTKDFVGINFQSCKFVFKIDGFLGL
jgi:hypothetical protein